MFYFKWKQTKNLFFGKKIPKENSDNSSNMVSLDHHQLKNNLIISIARQTLRNFNLCPKIYLKIYNHSMLMFQHHKLLKNFQYNTLIH